MALLFMEGWEWHNGNATSFARKYASVTAGSNTATGRLHGSSLAVSSTTDIRTRALVAPTSTVIIGFGYQDGTVGASSGNLEINIVNGASDQLRLRFVSVTSSTFRVDLMRGSTVLYSTASFSTLNWHYFELKAVIDPSAGSWELRRNETSLSSASGVNTADSGSANWDTIHITGATEGTLTGNPRLDDLYVLEGTGTINNDFLGDSVIEGRLPTGDSAVESDWTPSSGSDHFDLMDDENDSTYVSSGTAGDIDLYTFDALSFITGTIHGIFTLVEAGLDSAGTRTIRNKVRSNGTNYNGGSQVVETTGKDGFYEVWETDPDTGVKWTSSGANAAEFGFELVS